METCVKELAQKCIREAAQRHGFDADEEIRLLGLENLTIIREEMAKKSVSKREDKVMVSNVKDNKSNKNKQSFPMPFIKETVESDGCQGIAYNRGLFTQCLKNRMENGLFCKGCQTEADNNASGCPDCGTVESRLAADLYTFKDPNGRSPVSYVKFLNKLKLTTDAAIEEAGKLNIIIPNEHLVIIEKVKKSDASEHGRPKKNCVVEADNVTDLFAKLVSEDNFIEDYQDNETQRTSTPKLEDEDEDVIEECQNKSVKKSKSKLSDEEKAIKKAQQEEERANKKAERELLIATEKAEKEAKRLAEQAEKEAEKEAKRLAEQAERELKIATEKAEKEAKLEQERAKKQAEKDEKEAKRLAEKAEKEAEKAKKDAEKEAEKAKKEAEKEAKRLAEEAKKLEKAKKDAEKEAKKLEKETKKTDTPVVTQDKPNVEENQFEPPPTKVTVTRIQIAGKHYLKSSSNILYDPNTKEEVGLWDPETKTIKDLPEDEDQEEEEDDYDTDGE
jgi:hypothetical protein